MAEALRAESANELLKHARRHFASAPDEESSSVDQATPSGEGRVRMYRGQPVAAPAAPSRRARSYRGAPVEAPARAAAGRTGATSMVDKLRQLQDLRESGVIDEAEFSRLKRALLEE